MDSHNCFTGLASFTSIRFISDGSVLEGFSSPHFREIAIMRDAAARPYIGHQKLLSRSQMSGWREFDASDDGVFEH